MGIEQPYEVISSEDMLSRLKTCNDKIDEIRKEKEDKTENGFSTKWDWRKEYMLLGSDVISLFPSLSAEKTACAVRNQLEK